MKSAAALFFAASLCVGSALACRLVLHGASGDAPEAAHSGASPGRLAPDGRAGPASCATWRCRRSRAPQSWPIPYMWARG